MIHDHFVDFPAASGRQHRHEPMHLTVQFQLLDHSPPVALETAVVVVQAHPGDDAD